MTIQSSDGVTRKLRYESFNVFEKQNGRWVYAAEWAPRSALKHCGSIPTG